MKHEHKPNKTHDRLIGALVKIFPNLNNPKYGIVLEKDFNSHSNFSHVVFDVLIGGRVYMIPKSALEVVQSCEKSF